jgi:hypothetical protein
MKLSFLPDMRGAMRQICGALQAIADTFDPIDSLPRPKTARELRRSAGVHPSQLKRERRDVLVSDQGREGTQIVFSNSGSATSSRQHTLDWS